MRMVRQILVFGIALTLLTAGLVYGAEPIKIGAVLRLSIGAEHGIPSKRGVEMAVAEVNKAGGINGRQVEVIFEDEKDSPAASVNAVQKLINVDKVVALVGHMTSGGMMAAGKIANDAKVVEISPTATTPKLSGYGCGRVLQSAALVARYAPAHPVRHLLPGPPANVAAAGRLRVVGRAALRGAGPRALPVPGPGSGCRPQRRNLSRNDGSS